MATITASVSSWLSSKAAATAPPEDTPAQKPHPPATSRHARAHGAALGSSCKNALLPGQLAHGLLRLRLGHADDAIHAGIVINLRKILFRPAPDTRYMGALGRLQADDLHIGIALLKVPGTAHKDRKSVV